MKFIGTINGEMTAIKGHYTAGIESRVEATFSIESKAKVDTGLI